MTRIEAYRLAAHLAIRGYITSARALVARQPPPIARTGGRP